MKKLIFTLFVAFFCYSQALNAQNSSKTDDNQSNTFQQKQLINAKAKKSPLKEAAFVSIYDKAAELNANFIQQGLLHRAQVVEFKGKKIIKLVEGLASGAKYYQLDNNKK